MLDKSALTIFEPKYLNMNLVNPAVTDGVNLFVNIVVVLIAFATALSLLDIRKQNADEK
jgi:hypothetical protein